jgi:hypothetical protein
MIQSNVEIIAIAGASSGSLAVNPAFRAGGPEDPRHRRRAAQSRRSVERMSGQPGHQKKQIARREFFRHDPGAKIHLCFDCVVKHHDWHDPT